MKTAYISVHVGEIVFDSESDNSEVLKEYFEKCLKNFVPSRFDIDIEDDEDYDEDNECYGLSHYVIENGVLR